MRKTRLLAGLATLAVVASAFPASAQVVDPPPVEVLLQNPGGSRVLVVENLDGTPLTKLDFGTSRSMPFRVRVVDDTFDREDFNVTATMTNLYRADALGNVDYGLPEIASDDIALGSMSTVGALDVKAVVQPVLDTVTTIDNGVICQLLGLTALPAPCQLVGTDVLGKLTEVTLPTQALASLDLPLVPDGIETGPFTNPEHGFGTLGFADPTPSALAPTPRRVLGGDASPLDLSALDDVLAGLSAASLIDTNALLGEFGNLPLNTLPQPLVTELIDSLLNSTTVVTEALTLDDILNQTGQYLSTPTLDVTVPVGAEQGDYKGTLVITAMQ